MSASLLTISKRRIREIVSEVVTAKNLEHAILQLLGQEYKSKLKIIGGETAADLEQVVKFEIQASDRAELDDISSKLAPLSGDEVRTPVGMEDIGMVELTDDTGPDPEGALLYVGGATDFMPQGAPKPAGPTIDTALHDKNWGAPGQEQAATLQRHQRGQHVVDPTAQRSRQPRHVEDKAVKALTATVLLMPVKTAMTVHAGEDVDPRVWWEEVKKELVAQSKAQLPQPTAIRVGPWIRGAAKKIVQDVMASAPDSITQVLDAAELEDDLVDAYEDPDSGIFGETPTAISPPVSESLDPLRRLVRQIINESRLSKDA